MNEEKMSTAIKGAIGEFYVASFLSAMGLVVALPRSGVPSSDLIVTTHEGHRSISIQVKTSLSPINKSKKYGDYWSWDVSKKAKENRSKFHWYAFVNAYNWPRSESSPRIFFVPSEVVANIVAEWNDGNAPRLFFRIMELGEQDLYAGVTGFTEMGLALKEV
ncbi:MAG: hypothetical protein GJV46_01305 [Geobacter sp.]|nr:hypothetical protein [Geobacter sp.]